MSDFDDDDDERENSLAAAATAGRGAQNANGNESDETGRGEQVNFELLSSVSPQADCAPSPNTSSLAMTRVSQLRVQNLLRKLLLEHEESVQIDTLRVLRKTMREIDFQLSWLTQIDFLETIERILRISSATDERKQTSENRIRGTLKLVDGNKNYRDKNELENSDDQEQALSWRLVHDATQLLIESLSRLPHEIDRQLIESIVPNVVENLGHQRSEVRRASLLLLNGLFHRHHEKSHNLRAHEVEADDATKGQVANQHQAVVSYFKLILRLFLDYGLTNYRNKQAQRGAILSLPLLMSEQLVSRENLTPLVKCLSELLLIDSNENLFYSLYLAMQRLHLMMGDEKFQLALSECEPEAAHLYRQAASRQNSLVVSGSSSNANYPNIKQGAGHSTRVQPVEFENNKETQQQQLQKEKEKENVQQQQQQQHVTFESNSSRSSSRSSSSASEKVKKSAYGEQGEVNEQIEGGNKLDEARELTRASSQSSRAESCRSSMASLVSSLSESDNDDGDGNKSYKTKGKTMGVPQAQTADKLANSNGDDSAQAQAQAQAQYQSRFSSDVSSTCSSDAHLVNPAHYMTRAALAGNPLDHYEEIHHIDHSNMQSLAINDFGPICNTPTMDIAPQLLGNVQASLAHHLRANTYNNNLNNNSISSSANNRLVSSGSGGGPINLLANGNEIQSLSQLTTSELKYGIFPRHLIQIALQSARASDRYEAMQELMCIIRESPINHLAILMTYFDSFLAEFLSKILLNRRQSDASFKLELIGIDMIESLIIKTKVSTMQYIRPIVGLLMRSLIVDSHQQQQLQNLQSTTNQGQARVLGGHHHLLAPSIFRENACRCLHKMMAYLPPQHVIDALFEHKHQKSPVIREEAINRVTAAILEYDKNEFNLTRLCYHILPMLADHEASVRLASLECIATLAHVLGPERIGSLLTAAEAVQTGCDYDGLLDAINARLMRHTLPRCQSNGIVRYVLKPFLTLSQDNQETRRPRELPADVRWVLEAPSTHQHHPGGPYYKPGNHNHHHHHQQQHQHNNRQEDQSFLQDQRQEDLQQHHHRLGVYSPPTQAERRRRSSVGLAHLQQELQASDQVDDRNKVDARHKHQDGDSLARLRSSSLVADQRSLPVARRDSRAEGSRQNTTESAGDTARQHVASEGKFRRQTGGSDESAASSKAKQPPQNGLSTSTLSAESNGASGSQDKSETNQHNQQIGRSQTGDEKSENNGLVRRKSRVGLPSGGEQVTQAEQFAKRRDEFLDERKMEQQAETRAEMRRPRQQPPPPPHQQQQQQLNCGRSNACNCSRSELNDERRRWNEADSGQQQRETRFRRSNSQESVSSTDTSKFKQSLADSSGNQAVLPSDSIIYTDVNRAYELTRHRTRFQQTSFDYEPGSVGRVPEPPLPPGESETNDAYDRRVRGNIGQESSRSTSGPRTRRKSLSTGRKVAPAPGVQTQREVDKMIQSDQQQQSRNEFRQLEINDNFTGETTSGSESPQTIFEAPIGEAKGKRVTHSNQRQRPVLTRSSKSIQQQQQEDEEEKEEKEAQVERRRSGSVSSAAGAGRGFQQQRGTTTTNSRQLDEKQNEPIGAVDVGASARASGRSTPTVGASRRQSIVSLNNANNRERHSTATNVSRGQREGGQARDSGESVRRMSRANSNASGGGGELEQSETRRRNSVVSGSKEGVAQSEDAGKSTQLERRDSNEMGKTTTSGLSLSSSSSGEASATNDRAHRRRDHSSSSSRRRSRVSGENLSVSGNVVVGTRPSIQSDKNAAGAERDDDDNDDDGGENKRDDEREERAAVRRRASRSQPPVSRARSTDVAVIEIQTQQQQQEEEESARVNLRQATPSPPPPPPPPGRCRLVPIDARKQTVANDERGQAGSSSGGADRSNRRDSKRACSVSPSLSNSVNIRHILENVAQLEGPFAEPQLALKVAMSALDSPCWSTKVEGILALIRLVAYETSLQQSTRAAGPVVLADGRLHEIVGKVSSETRNLRSTVARSAIFALGDFCARLGRLIEPELDLIVQSLLIKSSENTAFIRDDIRRSLDELCAHLTPWRVASALIHHGAGHKSVHVRKMASQFVAKLVEQMGPAKCLVGAREISAQLLPAAAKFAQDQSPHTRYYGRLVLSKLMHHNSFDRLLRRNLASTAYRSTIGIIESVKRRGPGELPAET